MSRICILTLMVITLFPVTSSSGDESPNSTNAGQNDRDVLGFGGKFKLGCWTPIFFNLSPDEEATHFDILAPDGNGRLVNFKGPLLSADSGKYQGWLKIGRTIGSIRYELYDNSNAVVHTGRFELGSSEALPVDSTTPLILTIEPHDAVRHSVKSIESQLFDTNCEVISLNAATDLPLCWLAYEGVRVVYLTTSNLELIQSISEKQLTAIETWVRNGGKLVFCAGRNSAEVFATPDGIQRFLPGEFEGTYEMKSSWQIERFTSSKLPLLNQGDEPLIAVSIKDSRGINEPKDSQTPLVVRQPLGFGQVIFSTVDFDIPPFSDWSGQKNFLLKATFQNLNLNRTASTETESRRVVRVGYRDLVGQLMLPLEKFSRVRFVNFTIVALLIGLFILCIGPGDFFLLRKMFRTMEWTWVTFTLLSLAFCGLAVAIAGSTKPPQMQINQLEIIDIDAENNTVRGNIWTNLYSPNNSKCNVSHGATNALGIDTSLSNISWLGLPGDGLGGMQSKTKGGFYEQPYECDLHHQLLDDSFTAQLAKMPIQVSSTKTLFTRYRSKTDLFSRSRLELNRSRNRLNGTVTNPLDVEIKDCRLLFENRVYKLSEPLGPGETIEVYSDMKERTSNFYFSRREENGSDKEGGLPWNPQDDDLARIAEILMFHESARGKQYTGMTHGYQTFVDLSENVELGRAILFGQVGDVCTQLNIETENVEAAYDHSKTFVRIVLPVEYN